MKHTHHLSIDIETYSSVDIKKAGMYKYAQSPDFEVLLFAYSLNGGPVIVLDMTSAGGLPDWLRVLLVDPGCIKHAYNAAFEWYCLSCWLGIRLPLEQWRCTMLHGLYCGYTAGLSATGKALGLPEDRRKFMTGNALIKYFCVPCAPTKANGGRTRNFPRHDVEKWKLFIVYNRQDVVTEMEIERRLSNFPVPERVQKEWELDMAINARGVAVDMDLVGGAIWCGETVKNRLVQEAKELTGLTNPNSASQLLNWLNEELQDDENIEDLKKDTVQALLSNGVDSSKAQRMLELRQQMSKTSTRKFNAMEASACADRRVRGMFQFYGANRTGRWAGRIVQFQNLPRMYLDHVNLAREFTRERLPDMLELIYGAGTVPDTLSQLVRAAFVSAPGYALVDADFSAIEARVIAWLAGEEWVLEVFRTHGKIYEACASQMFGVPIGLIAKGNPEYGLRQKGKVATLALGYQGGVGALKKMKALEMGLKEEELPEIVERWRQANPRIRELWYALEAAAVGVLQTGSPVSVRRLTFAREMDRGNGLDYLTIQLPSGRKLYYAHPYLTTNQWGNPSIGHWGMDQTSKKWKQLETYGGKLAENCVQAIARDCLAENIIRLEAAGLPVVAHVHDEVVLEVPEKEADLKKVTDIMSQPIPWAPGLPLKAEGWVDTYFKKD